MNVEYEMCDYVTRMKTLERVFTHEREIPNWRARLASVLIERWGMIAAEDGGEDSAGRAKLRLLAPLEVVARACEVADLAVSEFSERGWITVLPPLSELMAASQSEARGG